MISVSRRSFAVWMSMHRQHHSAEERCLKQWKFEMDRKIEKTTNLYLPSSPGLISNFPSSHSLWTSPKPLIRSCTSSSEIIPTFPIALAYATDPRISCAHMRLSNHMLSLNFSMMGSVPPLNRPPAPNNPPRAPVAAINGIPIYRHPTKFCETRGTKIATSEDIRMAVGEANSTPVQKHTFFFRRRHGNLLFYCSN